MPDSETIILTRKQKWQFLIICIVWLLVCTLFYFVTQSPFDYLHQLDTNFINEYIIETNFMKNSKIDVIILNDDKNSSKSVENENHNFTLVSILRFAPWVNMIHIEQSENDNDDFITLYDQWEDDGNIIFFKKNLLDYSLTTPVLSEQFIIFQPNVMLTNYIFPWQFFIHQSPVYRFKNPGIIPCTRKMMNECIYSSNSSTAKKNTNSLIIHSLVTGAKNKQLLYKNNRDHFKRSNPTMKHIDTLSSNEIKKYLAFTELHKDYSKYNIVIITDLYDYKNAIHQTFRNSTHPIIVVFLKFKTSTINPDNFQTFLAHIAIRKQTFVMVHVFDHQYVVEKVVANIMKQLNILNQKVESVGSYCEESKTLWNFKEISQKNFAHKVCERLSNAYDGLFFTFKKIQKEAKECTQMEQNRQSVL